MWGVDFQNQLIAALQVQPQSYDFGRQKPARPPGVLRVTVGSDGLCNGF
jgi:hypothetical protein